ncbi:MAG: S-adenosylmethionine:tRNA ribosyltransferase-isomerase [Bacteroidota bacterium]|jgi:S-adenosylmethionine:tRNA ribosyltransferase-isomerase|nr:S-adenosylmethionine:tRNA ribosyltransferase-isomerase [Cytophagales bacterium]MCE2958665.1 S-adenosylmethionine:tRNA ribosyltransferase-isomerase [Flammeovirgaceae bacterium]MCZ8072090.1 S-adenosylmethionine:tRNA ribosyltransferase-isomerase [Cytophagales bacterium]
MQSININEYKYDLPQERIALYPLEQRDHSKLLVYRQANISHQHFYELSQFLPEGATLFFNDTKVIPARLLFQKETGATIELFLLNPLQPSPLVAVSMEARGSSQWHVAIGNAKRWTDGQPLTLHLGEGKLTAKLVDKEKGIANFSWTPESLSFAEVVSLAGATPLPPYLKREVEASDRERYQTIYSKKEGAVAAPTAGLHFTDRVFEDLKRKNIQTDFLTLHVSAGTFQPVKVENAMDHPMHAEQMVVSKSNLQNLVNCQGMIVAVGTTSLRTLESLYWYGVKLEYNQHADFIIEQNEPYQNQGKLSFKAAVQNVLAKLDRDQSVQLIGETSIYIVPGYEIKSCDAIITNFHQPGSTLMLLVAAFVGPDWKKIYGQALNNGYRFLSYGDSSLLFRK